MNGDIEVAKYFVENGADINCFINDMVFPNNETPVLIASRHDNFEMVKWLCKNGADITISDKYGDRPYTEALKNGNKEMAEFLKNLEPADWHNEQNQIALFKKHEVPKELIEFLKSEDIRLKFSDECEIEYIDFFSYTDIRESKFKRKSILPLSAHVDNYSDIMLVWCRKEKAVCYIDTEHEVFAKLCDWNEFFINAEGYMERIITGEFN